MNIANVSPIMYENGYEPKTTFWSDFTIADAFGKSAVIDTFNRAFNEWKNNVEYVTELVMVLNHKIWQHYVANEPLARVYNDLWEKADGWCCKNLEGEDASYYYSTLD